MMAETMVIACREVLRRDRGTVIARSIWSEETGFDPQYFVGQDREVCTWMDHDRARDAMGDFPERFIGALAAELGRGLEDGGRDGDMKPSLPPCFGKYLSVTELEKSDAYWKARADAKAIDLKGILRERERQEKKRTTSQGGKGARG